MLTTAVNPIYEWKKKKKTKTKSYYSIQTKTKAEVNFRKNNFPNLKRSLCQNSKSMYFHIKPSQK